MTLAFLKEIFDKANTLHLNKKWYNYSKLKSHGKRNRLRYNQRKGITK